jgi:YVTN family beta-propeller protein
VAHLTDEQFCSATMPTLRSILGLLLAFGCCPAWGQAPPPAQQLAAGNASPITQSQSTPKRATIAPQAVQKHTLRQLGMVDIPGSPGFDAIAVANGKVLLTHTASSSLDVVDPAKRRVVAQVINLQSPRGIAVDQTNGVVYVAQAGNDSVAVVSFKGWQYSGSIHLADPPNTLVLDDSGQRLYWSSARNNSLSILDLGTRQTLGTIDLGGRPSGMVWDQERGVAFIALQDTAEIVAVDPKLQIVSRFKLSASQPTSLVYDPRTRRLFVAVRNAVVAISDQDGSETRRVDAPMGVDDLWLAPESRTLYAASPGELTVIKAGEGQFTVVDIIPSSIKGHNVAFDSESNMIFLPGGREGKSAMLLLRPMSSEEKGEQDVAARVK